MTLRNLFSTGPRIKIRAGNPGKTIAYAIGFDINVSVDVIPVYVLGDYKAQSLEPVMYQPVTGTFQVMRLRSPVGGDKSLTPGTISKAGELKADDPTTTALNETQTATIGYSIKTFDANGQEINTNVPVGPNSYIVTPGKNDVESLNQGALFQQIDPRTILFSESLDFTIYIKVPFTAVFGENGAGGLTYKEVPWLNIKDVRITSRNTNISMGQLMSTPLNFQGLLASPTDENGINNFAPDNSSIDGGN